MCITYSENGSRTTLPISTAPFKQKVLWNLGNVLGINIIRIRKNKKRYGTQAGNTFKGRHFGFYSFFTELKRPVQPLWNSSMTILEDNNLYL
jgi:hypothetical protein